jgi:hypothetical protein
MPDSWRDILERAAKNLSIDLDREANSGFRHQLAGWPAAKRQTRRHSFAESREMLALELEAIAGGPPRSRNKHAAAPQPARFSRPPITQAIKPPQPEGESAQAQPRWGRALAMFVATAVSAAVTVLTTYAFFILMR